MKNLFQNSANIFILIAALFLCVQNVFSQEDLAGYHVMNEVIVNNVDNDLMRVVVMIPFAKTNVYQTISNVDQMDGELLAIPGSDDQYLRWFDEDQLPKAGEKKSYAYNFNVYPIAVNFDFKQVSEIYPYDEDSEIYKRYTGSSGEYVMPDHPVIQELGEMLWKQSADLLDYARNCYNYVAANYSYLNPMTGLHTIQEILDNGGGDCGNLSSIFISLLRYKKIPARHIVTVLLDGNYHVWSDFYLEQYGWIPADVTVKNLNTELDYFGRYDGNGIVVGTSAWPELDRGDDFTYHAPILQTFNWWYWYNSGGNTITAEHSLKATEGVGYLQHEMRTIPNFIPQGKYGQFKLSFSDEWENDEPRLLVFNLSGQLIKKQSIRLNPCFIDFGYLEQGMYIFEMSGDQFTYSQKINLQ